MPLSFMVYLMYLYTINIYKCIYQETSFQECLDPRYADKFTVYQNRNRSPPHVRSPVCFFVEGLVAINSKLEGGGFST